MDSPLHSSSKTHLSTLPWTFLDYPRITHCRQAHHLCQSIPVHQSYLGHPCIVLSKDDSLAVYKQTPLPKYPCAHKLLAHLWNTLDVLGLSKGDLLPAGRPVCQGIPVAMTKLS